MQDHMIIHYFNSIDSDIILEQAAENSREFVLIAGHGVETSVPLRIPRSGPVPGVARQAQGRSVVAVFSAPLKEVHQLAADLRAVNGAGSKLDPARTSPSTAAAAEGPALVRDELCVTTARGYRW